MSALQRTLTRARVLLRGGRRVAFRWCAYDDLSADFAGLGVTVEPYRVDVGGFWAYVDRARYRERPYYDGGRRPLAVEKWLEHYISLELLRPSAGEILVDIASDPSPFPDIVNEIYGVRTYRQDINWEPGLHGDRIGGDAVTLPLDDESVQMLALHCAFEHFEGDRDGRFLREAARVLAPGGRLCILPLYTMRRYAVQTDMVAWARHPPELDPRALTCVAEGWGEMHGRFYDLPAFRERFLAHLGNLRLTMLRVENHREVDEQTYVKLVALIKKPFPSGAGEETG